MSVSDDSLVLREDHHIEDYEAVQIVPLTELHTFKNHPFKVTHDEQIPFATMANREWGQMGNNYLRSLFALGFQAFLIIICVAIYAVLVQSIATEADVIAAIWTCVGYTVLLCFCLFKTSTLSKAVFNSH